MSTTSPHLTPDASSQRLVIFGEVLFDAFPDGREVLGGAPFNVAWGLAGLGQNPYLISAVGADGKGLRVLQQMTGWGMAIDGVSRLEQPTGVVQISLQNGDASYLITEEVAWDFIPPVTAPAREFLYHGLLALRSETSRHTFEGLVARSPGAERFFDVNLRPPYDDFALVEKWVSGATWVKMNFEEFQTLVGKSEVSFPVPDQVLDSFLAEKKIKNLLLTAGRDGAQIHGSYGRALQCPAPPPVQLVDTVGAGDSFAAVTIDGILKGLPADLILTKASLFASKVCGLRGATSTDPSFYQT